MERLDTGTSHKVEGYRECQHKSAIAQSVCTPVIHLAGFTPVKCTNKLTVSKKQLTPIPKSMLIMPTAEPSKSTGNEINSSELKSSASNKETISTVARPESWVIASRSGQRTEQCDDVPAISGLKREQSNVPFAPFIRNGGIVVENYIFHINRKSATATYYRCAEKSACKARFVVKCLFVGVAFNPPCALGSFFTQTVHYVSELFPTLRIRKVERLRQ